MSRCLFNFVTCLFTFWILCLLLGLLFTFGYACLQVRARRDDLPFLVTLWNASLKQLNPRVAGAARDVRGHLKAGLKWKPRRQEVEEQPPDASVLRRLQGELDFAVVDGVTSDAKLIDDKFKAGLGAGCMAEEDGALDF